MSCVTTATGGPHQESFSSDDAYRALDSVGRLLTAVSAPQSDELERLKMELLRVRFDEQARGERRRQAGTTVGSAVATGLKPWREIVTPHKDVASGRYQQAEFAADLWQVHLGEGTDEYRDPVEFFRRTYLTESLKGLLVGAIRRLAGRGGAPVVQLQTNVGGGKTHSMLALFHLFSGTAPGDLAGIDAVLQKAQATNLGKFAASRRVARAIYLGSAPTADAAQRGIEDRRVKLGCVMPGETPAVFGDALRRLAGAATYLYQDGPRYWYSTQPTVTKLAEDRAEQMKRDPDKVVQELGSRLRADLRSTGEFNRVHPLPQSGQDVPDDRDARLVVLGIDTPYSKERGNPAETAAKAILESRGSVPRIYRNSLVFLAVDKTRLQDLDEAVRRYLAWESILGEREPLDLSPYQVKQGEIQKEAASSAVTARLPEAYQWLLVPGQSSPDAPIEWLAMRLSGQDSLAARASKRLKGDELLVTGFAATRLRMELDRVPLWRGDHVSIKQIVEDFARYLYLPRVGDPTVLLKSMSGGVALLTWEHDAFAFADSFDDEVKRYRGLRGGQLVSLPDADAPGLLVKPDVARQQLDAEKPQPGGGGEAVCPGSAREAPHPGDGPGPGVPPPDTPTATQPKRFHGTVLLDSTRVGRDASRIADEVISHLSGLVGARVTVTLEISAEVPSGAPDHVVRTVTENSRTLKFTTQGFEKE